MAVIVDAPKAIEIAQKFLEKYHDTINLKSSSLDEAQKVWTIKVDVGFLSEQLKKIRVDANDGNILGYE